MSDRELVQQVQKGMTPYDQPFAARFYEDLPQIQGIYGKDVNIVYARRAKIMLQLDLFDQDGNLRAPRNIQEAQRVNHLLLKELIDNTEIDIQKILTHMGVPKYPIKGRDDLRYLLKRMDEYIG